MLRTPPGPHARRDLWGAGGVRGTPRLLDEGESPSRNLDGRPRLDKGLRDWHGIRIPTVGTVQTVLEQEGLL